MVNLAAIFSRFGQGRRRKQRNRRGFYESASPSLACDYQCSVQDLPRYESNRRTPSRQGKIRHGCPFFASVASLTRYAFVQTTLRRLLAALGRTFISNYLSFLEESQENISDKGAFQLLFDLAFLNKILGDALANTDEMLDKVARNIGPRNQVALISQLRTMVSWRELVK
jgi:hypothetical protein